MRLHPIFPYFLKTRLNDAAQVEPKQAIEAAFCEHYNMESAYRTTHAPGSKRRRCLRQGAAEAL
ncbi:MAG: hypothetical protein KDJ65_21090 [Anaerolineae bacterium]|nr:hypothetical protein [Anaerolineae bacterium]